MLVEGFRRGWLGGKGEVRTSGKGKVGWAERLLTGLLPHPARGGYDGGLKRGSRRMGTWRSKKGAGWG